MLPSPEPARSEDFAELPASRLPAQAPRDHDSSESCLAEGVPRHLPYTPSLAPSEGFLNSKDGFDLNIKGKASLCKQRAPKVTVWQQGNKKPFCSALPLATVSFEVGPPVLLYTALLTASTGAVGSYPKPQGSCLCPAPSCGLQGLQALGAFLGIPPFICPHHRGDHHTSLSTTHTESHAMQGMHNRLPSAGSFCKIPMHKCMRPQGWSCLTASLQQH